MDDPVKKQYEAMLKANAAFRKEFGEEINKAIPLYEDPTRYPVEQLVELFKFQWNFKEAKTQEEKDALKKEFAARRDAIRLLPNAPERVYLWNEGNMPTQTVYTENPDHLYDHEPDFRPYYLEMLLPAGQKPLAGIVLVAGGTHGAGTINECYEIGLEFNALGYSCFIFFFVFLFHFHKKIRQQMTGYGFLSGQQIGSGPSACPLWATPKRCFGIGLTRISIPMISGRSGTPICPTSRRNSRWSGKWSDWPSLLNTVTVRKKSWWTRCFCC